ncbi:MAG: hypothetical protein J2P36_32175, partial [Ktedonobacteraceae bacterium]|nr:hypothetical protein [Ktedonobacteraceae bacterium]
MTSNVKELTPPQYALLDGLLRTPFLCARDLALDVGLSMPQTYAHLRALAGQRLLESVSRPGQQRGPCRLYSLTPLGLKTFTQGQQNHSSVHVAGAQDQRLLALLPRLDRLAFGQALVHDLIVHAPAFFGREGKPATVRWTWIRDYQESLPALPQRAFRQPARFQVDWLLLFQVTVPGEYQSRCYPLFLIVDHECLPPHHIRHHLQTFLHARQVAVGRNPLAQEHFPALLIILPAWHRARHWQRWEAELTGGGRSQEVRGCLAVVTKHARSQPEQQRGTNQRSGSRPGAWNPWRLPWQTLHRYGPAQLHEQLRPYPESAIPHVWWLPSHHDLGMSEKAKKEKSMSADNASRATSATTRRLRAIRFGQFARRARTIRLAPHASPTALALMGLKLGRHQYRLMELLLVHPLLSSAQLGAFLGVQEVSVKQYLFAMRSLRCLETEQLVADPA